jgi:hypothetical protein
MRHALPLLLLLTLAPATASADLIAEPTPQPCDDKREGDACAPPGPGTCKKARCCDHPKVSATTQHYQEKQELDCRRCLGDKEVSLVPRRPDSKEEDRCAGCDEVLARAKAAEPSCTDCLKCFLNPPAPDMAQQLTPDMAPAPAAPAEKPKGGMCATTPWHSDAGAWSLLAGALLLTTLTMRRRA